MKKTKNQLITQWTPTSSEREKQRDLKFQIDSLIERARDALDKQTKIIDDSEEIRIQVKTEDLENQHLENQQVINQVIKNQVIKNEKIELASKTMEAKEAREAQISEGSDNKNSDNKNNRSSELYESKKLNRIEEVIGTAAAKLAKDIGASCLISVERASKEFQESAEFILVKVSIYRRLNEKSFEKAEYLTKMRKVVSGSIVPIKELLVEAINKKYISKGDRVVCIEDESLGMGYKALLFVFDVDKILFNISTMNLGNNISPEVLEAVINLGLEIGKEGREGRKVGTAFIIGNQENMMKYTRQLIINPFAGYPEEQRSVLDPAMQATIKEFAQLDGAFIINEKGTLVSAGTYLNVETSNIDLPGYGTRHRCSAAITKHCTEAVSIVVSESGGIVSVFDDGRLVLKLP